MSNGFKRNLVKMSKSTLQRSNRKKKKQDTDFVSVWLLKTGAKVLAARRKRKEEKALTVSEVRAKR